MKTYRDRVKCPNGHRFTVYRRSGSAGRIVGTFCQTCSKMYQIKAGAMPVGAERKAP